jgi:hypothetical protein
MGAGGVAGPGGIAPDPPSSDPPPRPDDSDPPGGVLVRGYSPETGAGYSGAEDTGARGPVACGPDGAPADGRAGADWADDGGPDGEDGCCGTDTGGPDDWLVKDGPAPDRAASGWVGAGCAGTPGSDPEPGDPGDG